MGMLNASILSRVITGFAGRPGVRSYKVRFATRAWPGDDVICRGTVTRKFEKDGEKLVEGDLVAVNQKGETLISGSFVAGLARARLSGRLERPMIKRVTLLTRKAGMTREQFTRHWLDVHAPLAHAVQGLLRYVQSHIIEEYRRPDIPTTPVEVDGIAELWFKDRASMDRALASPEMAALHADGALFIGGNKSFTTVELEVVPGARGR